MRLPYYDAVMSYRKKGVGMLAPHWNTSPNLFRTILFFLAASFGFNGCSDVSSTSAPPPPPPPVPTVLTITSPSTINGTINTPFNVTLAAVAGTPPYTWSIIGNLPPGPNLTLNSATGVISGTPTGPSTSTIVTTRTYLVVDSTKPTAQTTQKDLTISINAAPQASIAGVGPITNVLPAPPTITPFTLSNGTVNVAYPTRQLEATGGIPPYTWSVAPALPNGLVFNLLGPGVISGTPLNASNGPTTHTFKVMDSSVPTGQVSELTRTFTINAGLTIDTGPPAGPLLPAGTVGQPYNATLSASGGTGPGTYTWSIVGNLLPAPGLQPLSSDGIITGTPTTLGPFTRTYRVQDTNGVAITKSLALTVNSALTIDTNDITLPLPAGIVGQPYSAALVASGGTGPGTYRWSLAAGSVPLPNGLTVNPDGTMIGTPTTAGTSTPTFIAADAASTAVEKRLSITINRPVTQLARRGFPSSTDTLE